MQFAGVAAFAEIVRPPELLLKLNLNKIYFLSNGYRYPVYG